MNLMKIQYVGISDILPPMAENRAKRNIPMTMEDWAKRLDMFLEFDDREIYPEPLPEVVKALLSYKSYAEMVNNFPDSESH